MTTQQTPSQNPLSITGRPPDRAASRGCEPANQPATETETETMIPSFIDQTQTSSTRAPAS